MYSAPWGMLAAVGGEGLQMSFPSPFDPFLWLISFFGFAIHKTRIIALIFSDYAVGFSLK